jgi:hypothetical protein
MVKPGSGKTGKRRICGEQKRIIGVRSSELAPQLSTRIPAGINDPDRAN